MAYVASVKRLVPMLSNPGARVLVAVNSQGYVDTLLSAIRQRMDEGAEDWRGGLLFWLAGEVRMPNGAVLEIKAVENVDRAHEFAGRMWTYILLSRGLPDDALEYLPSLARAPENYTGTVGFEQFEEWRDSPLEQPKEPDDEVG